jgi:GNAT superfamily N-acetyltransferase
VLTLEQIVRHSGCVTTEIDCRGETLTVRPLGHGDADMLSTYFDGLSERTRSWFAPHKFTREVAEELCSDLLSQSTLRLVAVTASDEPEIVAYFILQFGLREPEHDRFNVHGMPLDDAVACSLAPSVADAYQNAGLGSALLRHTIDVARRAGRTRMILFGGVGMMNPRAVHFYQKAGFRKVPPDAPGDEKFDMVLALDPPEG